MDLAVAFTNVSNGQGSTTRPAKLIIQAPSPPRATDQIAPSGGRYLLDNRGGYLLDERGSRPTGAMSGSTDICAILRSFSRLIDDQPIAGTAWSKPLPGAAQPNPNVRKSLGQHYPPTSSRSRSNTIACSSCSSHRAGRVHRRCEARRDAGAPINSFHRAAQNSTLEDHLAWIRRRRRRRWVQSATLRCCR